MKLITSQTKTKREKRQIINIKNEMGSLLQILQALYVQQRNIIDKFMQINFTTYEMAEFPKKHKLPTLSQKIIIQIDLNPQNK